MSAESSPHTRSVELPLNDARDELDVSEQQSLLDPLGNESNDSRYTSTSSDTRRLKRIIKLLGLAVVLLLVLVANCLPHMEAQPPPPVDRSLSPCSSTPEPDREGTSRPGVSVPTPTPKPAPATSSAVNPASTSASASLPTVLILVSENRLRLPAAPAVRADWLSAESNPLHWATLTSRAYARCHSYTFANRLPSNRTGRTGVWNKLAAMLESDLQLTRDFDYVLMLDSDATFVNFSSSLTDAMERFAPGFINDPQQALLVSKDHASSAYNAGVVLVKTMRSMVDMRSCGSAPSSGPQCLCGPCLVRRLFREWWDFAETPEGQTFLINRWPAEQGVLNVHLIAGMFAGTRAVRLMERFAPFNSPFFGVDAPFIAHVTSGYSKLTRLVRLRQAYLDVWQLPCTRTLEERSAHPTVEPPPPEWDWIQRIMRLQKDDAKHADVRLIGHDAERVTPKTRDSPGSSLARRLVHSLVLQMATYRRWLRLFTSRSPSAEFALSAQLRVAAGDRRPVSLRSVLSDPPASQWPAEFATRVCHPLDQPLCNVQIAACNAIAEEMRSRIHDAWSNRVCTAPLSVIGVPPALSTCDARASWSACDRLVQQLDTVERRQLDAHSDEPVLTPRANGVTMEPLLPPLSMLLRAHWMSEVSSRELTDDEWSAREWPMQSVLQPLQAHASSDAWVGSLPLVARANWTLAAAAQSAGWPPAFASEVAAQLFPAVSEPGRGLPKPRILRADSRPVELVQARLGQPLCVTIVLSDLKPQPHAADAEAGLSGVPSSFGPDSLLLDLVSIASAQGGPLSRARVHDVRVPVAIQRITDSALHESLWQSMHDEGVRSVSEAAPDFVVYGGCASVWESGVYRFDGSWQHRRWQWAAAPNCSTTEAPAATRIHSLAHVLVELKAGTAAPLPVNRTVAAVSPSSVDSDVSRANSVLPWCSDGAIRGRFLRSNSSAAGEYLQRYTVERSLSNAPVLPQFVRPRRSLPPSVPPLLLRSSVSGAVFVADSCRLLDYSYADGLHCLSQRHAVIHWIGDDSSRTTVALIASAGAELDRLRTQAQACEAHTAGPTKQDGGHYRSKALDGIPEGAVRISLRTLADALKPEAASAHAVEATPPSAAPPSLLVLSIGAWESALRSLVPVSSNSSGVPLSCPHAFRSWLPTLLDALDRHYLSRNVTVVIRSTDPREHPVGVDPSVSSRQRSLLFDHEFRRQMTMRFPSHKLRFWDVQHGVTADTPQSACGPLQLHSLLPDILHNFDVPLLFNVLCNPQ